MIGYSRWYQLTQKILPCWHFLLKIKRQQRQGKDSLLLWGRYDKIDLEIVIANMQSGNKTGAGVDYLNEKIKSRDDKAKLIESIENKSKKIKPISQKRF